MTKTNNCKLALDMLKEENTPAKEKLEAVINDNLIPDNMLHEFACQCGERVLSFVCDDDDDECFDMRKVCVEHKRKWLKGEIEDLSLEMTNAAVSIQYDLECACGDILSEMSIHALAAVTWFDPHCSALQSAFRSAEVVAEVERAAWKKSKKPLRPSYEEQDAFFDLAKTAEYDKQVVSLMKMLEAELLQAL